VFKKSCIERSLALLGREGLQIFRIDQSEHKIVKLDVVSKLTFIKIKLTLISSSPYTEATICEVLRLSSFVPLGIFHRTLHDTEFGGFIIRKGTLVLANLYSAHYNPDKWNEPERFLPERFLTPSGEKAKNPPYFLPFQVGRRQCLGESFAMDSLFLFVTSIFQNLKISPYIKSEMLDLEPISGILRIPKPFRVKIDSRQ